MFSQEEQFQSLCQKILIFSNSHSVTARQFSQLLSFLISLADVVPLGSLHILPHPWRLESVYRVREGTGWFSVTLPENSYFQQQSFSHGSTILPTSGFSEFSSRCGSSRLPSHSTSPVLSSGTLGGSDVFLLLNKRPHSRHRLSL
jgi:hypothetical protein